MFANIKLGVRLGAGFAIVLGLAVAMAGVGTYALSTLSANSEKLARNDAPRLEAALRLDVSANSNARRLTEILLAKEQKEIDRLAKQFDVNEQKTAEAVEDLSKLSLSEDAVSVMATIKENHNKYAAAAKKMTGLAQADKHDEAAEAYDKEVSPMLTKFSRSISEFLEYDDGLFSHAMDETHAVYNKGRMVLGGIAALAVLLGAFIAWASARSITKPIKAAVLIANRVAEGDLTSEIDVRSRDELGQLMSALKLMNGNLQNIVSEVRRGSGEISSASTEIAAGNLDLSRRTEQQAASLEETASSMEELTSTVKQSAENARHANQLALGASDVAVKGGVVVGQVVTTMSGISEASHKIADIIGVIDGIAFQTNILALNAAVEAARAGEQGRGFAVVATEVCTLAQRSAAAAKEIKTLIQDSVGKVDSGRKLVDQAGRTMEEIVSAVKSVTGIMAEIASAAQEQNSGIEQVNQAVSQMDQVTQQNAALVEEAAAAAASMQEQAMGLTQAVAVFKLADESDEASDDESAVSTLASQDEPEQAVSEHRPVERRSANRPANVARLPAVREAKASDKVVAAKTGTDDDWSEF